MPEPVALDDIKAHLRLDPDATGEDDYLSALIVAARRTCEYFTGRVIVAQAATIAIDGFPRAPSYVNVSYPEYCLSPDRGPFEVITLPAGTVASVESIVYLDDTGASIPLDPSAWRADIVNDPARVYPVDAWPLVPELPGSVTISYSVSPLDADDLTVVGQAIRLMIGSWYRNREATQVDARGVPAEIPLAVHWLLNPLVDFGRS